MMPNSVAMLALTIPNRHCNTRLISLLAEPRSSSYLLTPGSVRSYQYHLKLSKLIVHREITALTVSVIPRHISCVDLRITTGNELSFKPYISKIVSKARQTTSIIFADSPTVTLPLCVKPCLLTSVQSYNITEQYMRALVYINLH